VIIGSDPLGLPHFVAAAPGFAEELQRFLASVR
jgi:hypothetical protein